VTKAEAAYELVRERLLGGDLPPGAVIPQAALARELGVSTTPLREALRRLMTEGLVELDAHRDARVTRLTLEEARDLIEVRRSLDPLAAALAAERRTRDDLALIRRTADELRPLRADPGPAELLTHRRFHVAIYTASHNQLLVQSLDGLWDKADRYRRLALEDGRTEEDLDRTHAEHRALVDAIAAGDSAAAGAAMLAHVEASLGARAVARLTSVAAEPAARSLRGIRGGRA
jgi:DNA-binding GntR family transcriptional regulator